MRLDDYLYKQGLIKTSCEFKTILYRGYVAVNGECMGILDKDKEVDPKTDVIKLYRETLC